MASTCGIIAEYNPFHNGHLHNILRAKEAAGADTVIIALSGNFVQRGEPAIIDKYLRTRAALQHGADMVLELPTPYATASAESFARGGVRLLAATGVVQYLCFGTESGDISPLNALADLLVNETADFKSVLRKNLSQGKSFAVARQAAICAASPDLGEKIKTGNANNILGVEYIKAIKRENLALVPIAVKRYGAAHNSSGFLQTSASASAIRKYVAQDNNLDNLASILPAKSLEMLQSRYQANAINHINNLSPYFHFALQNIDDVGCFGLQEGLVNRLIAASAKNYLISDIILAAKCKNHAYTAIQRAILHILLGITPQQSTSPVPYIRVLGVRRNRRDLLNQLYRSASLPIITNLKHSDNLPAAAKTMLEKELVMSRTYWLGLKPAGVTGVNEYSMHIVVI